MSQRRALLCLAGVVAMTLASFSVAAAARPSSANPCAGPAGAHNPNCDEHGAFNPPGRGLPDPGEAEPAELLDLVRIHPLSTAEGVYEAVAASFGPPPTEDGVDGPVEVVSSRSGVPSEGCTSLVGFGAGAIAVVDRGGCPFATKVANAEAAGAIAVIVVNNEASQPIVMGAANDTATITAVMVSQTDGAAIKDGLPADGTVGLIPPDPVFPNVLEVDPPSSAAGSYGLAGANFGPPLSPAGVSGQLELVDDGSDDPTRGCNPLIGFPAGSIAVIDRGDCNFTTKVGNAQAAGAIAVVIVNDLPGSPTQMGGADPGIVIPSGMVSQSDGDLIRAGLPATGVLRANE